MNKQHFQNWYSLLKIKTHTKNQKQFVFVKFNEGQNFKWVKISVDPNFPEVNIFWVKILMFN